LAVAKIFKPHALRGEVSVQMLSDFPDRLKEGKTVYLGEAYSEHTIHSIRKAGKTYLVSFKGHQTREAVEHLRNVIVYVKGEVLPQLEQHEYYHHDLIGMRVVDSQENPVGVLTEIITTGANDVYVIKPEEPDRNDILLPAIRSVVRKVDLEAGIMVVDLPEWY
jgi:16S rRNA processing protein RimM